MKTTIKDTHPDLIFSFLINNNITSKDINIFLVIYIIFLTNFIMLPCESQSKLDPFLIEDQIERMVNTLLLDQPEEPTVICFADDDDGQFDSSLSQSTSVSVNNYKRNGKKFPTISFTNPLPCQSFSASLFRPRHNTKHFNSNLPMGRPGSRKNTYELMKNQAAFCNFKSLQMEMMLIEVGNALLKVEQIDYYIYTRLQRNFTNVIKTHKGSKLFQNYLKNTSPDILHNIFLEIKPDLLNIISDPYANYFCKRFYTYLSQKDRVDFLYAIQSEIVHLSLDNIGTYPIQAIVDQVVSNSEKSIIIHAIEDSLALFCYDTYGTHVIEKILTNFDFIFTSFIYAFIIDNFMSLALDINGICVVKKALVYCDKENIHTMLFKFAVDNALKLVEHPFGNYVIQVIAENWSESEVVQLASQFKGKFLELSNKKYSSNVIERCLEKSQTIIEIYNEEVAGRIAEVMKNSYGNYVVQKALKVAKGTNREVLAVNVNKNIYKLYDKKLIAKWRAIVSFYLESN